MLCACVGLRRVVVGSCARRALNDYTSPCGSERVCERSLVDARAAARAVGERGIARHAERQRPQVVVALGLMRVEVRLHGGLVAHAERRPAVYIGAHTNTVLYTVVQYALVLDNELINEH